MMQRTSCSQITSSSADSRLSPAGSVEASAIPPEGNGVPALPPPDVTENDKRD